ncbi:MAG: AAA family ATPase, partial [Bordetella sp.]|nr:AAA family ATPase [Bordetella sp.]
GSDAAPWMRSLATHDPRDESAVQYLLSHATTTDEQQVASSAFQTLHRLLATEVGRKPLPRTFELQQHLSRHSLSTPAGPSPRADNVEPAAAGPRLFGREAEIAALSALLDEGSARLVSLVGFGGVGKTRLARTLHAQGQAQGRTRCVWIDLASVDSGHGILETIASAVDVPPRHGPLAEQLANWLLREPMLLFLDNFEQLVDHRSVIAALLDHVAHLRILATSRTPLGLAHEHVFSLGGLDVSGDESAAVQLYEEHARRLGNPVMPTEKSEVFELVAFLDGLPLAIELAVNWSPLFSARTVLEELRNDPSFIDAAQPAQRDGRRSMASIFDRTWASLNEDERLALTSVSVVLGTLSLDKAAALSSASTKTLGRLMQRSLLQPVEPDAFRVHPLLREMIQDRSARQTVVGAKLGHADFFLRLVGAPPALRSGQFSPARLQELLPHIDDIAQAWRHAVDIGARDLIALARANLVHFLFMASRYEEAWALGTYAAESRRAAPEDAPAFATWRAFSAFRLGKIGSAEDIARQALEGHPPSALRSRLNTVLARIHWFRGRYQLALSHAQTAMAVLENDDPFMRMLVLEDLAQCHFAVGNIATARELLEENLWLARAHGANQTEARALCLLGTVATGAHEPRLSVQLLAAARQRFEEIGDPYQMAVCARAVSYSHYQLGQIGEQLQAARDALETFKANGYDHEVGESLFALATALDAAGERYQSFLVCREGLERCRKVNNVPAAMRCLGGLGVFAIIFAGFRELGITVVQFALSQPEFRQTDRLSFERRVAALGISAADLAAAKEEAKHWTFDAICDRVLSIPIQPEAANRGHAGVKP